jgi:hypothetical protein
MGKWLNFAVTAATVLSGSWIAGAATARADSQDDHYLQQLDAYGVDAPGGKGATTAIEAGKLACNLKEQGLRDYDVNVELEAQYPRVDSNTIAKTAAVAILVYCPEYLHW